MIIKITNKSKNFYSHLGPVFGSRKVQRVTGDRFYDDEGKFWYIYYDKGVPTAFVAVMNNIIKNVWSDDLELLKQTLHEVYKKETIKTSTVPAVFKDVYNDAGFTIIENGSKNFIKIKGDENE